MKHTRTRNTLGDISVLYVHVLNRALESLGTDHRPLMARFGLSPELLSAPGARISIPRFMRLGQAATEACGDPALGLIMGEMSRPVDAGRAGLAAACAPRAGRALQTLVEFSLLTSRNSRGVPSMADNTRIAEFYSIRPYNIFNYFVVDSVLAAWVQFLRTITGHHRVVEKVEIEYDSRGLDERFSRWFDCPVIFGATGNRITLRAGVEKMASLEAQPAMHELLRGECQRELARIRAGWTTADRVRELLPSLLQGEPPVLEDIAPRLGIAPWTLQRQLAAENTGFRELIDLTRQDLALDYLRETTLSLAEIAWLLGFSGPPAFQKAYRRWHNISPGAHRKTLQQQRKLSRDE